MWSSSSRSARARLGTLVLAGVLSACGFHLRGSGGGITLPAALSTVRVVAPGPAQNEPLTVAVRETLAQAGARIVDAGVPALVLVSEQVESRVASVSTATAKASEYLLQYAVTFRLDGPQSLPAQTVRLQRDFTADPTQVLAREQQERELLRDLRRDAAQQIVRRVVRGVGAR